MRKRAWPGVLVALLVGGLLLLAVGCGGDDSSDGGTATASTGDPKLDKLVAAAQEEGEVTFYSVPDERIAQQLADAFEQKYGIETSFTRATAAEVEQRFSAEADAGAPVADVMLTLNDGFLADAVEKGWMTPLDRAGIPSFPGDWIAPQAILKDPTTVAVQITNMGIGFNTDEAGDDAPETWEDVLDPKWKGKVGIADPNNAIHNDLFYVLSQQYGMDYLTRLGEQINRIYPGGAPMVESLASGETPVAIGIVAAGLEVAKEQGAPLGWSIPQDTLASPTVIGVAAEAPHPNAAKLLAHYILSREGLKLLNDSPGSVSPTEKDGLPSEFASPALDAEARQHQSEIFSALGAE
jgi:iron(III) transport system substrate-binding protein